MLGVSWPASGMETCFVRWRRLVAAKSGNGADGGGVTLSKIDNPGILITRISSVGLVQLFSDQLF
jgi:hypothetical protein